MSNRRVHPRFELPVPCQATLHIVRDVSITRNGRSELVCIGSVKGVVGEEVTLEVLGANGRAAVTARIVESRPLPANGSMRYEMHLQVVQDTAGAGLERSLPVGSAQ
jgi:hypothetical protein